MDSLFVVTNFLERIGGEAWCNPSHISLYIALISVRNQQGDCDPFSISRRQIMDSSKIHSNATYHKCMKELINAGFIRYLPSYHPVLGSLVWLLG